MNGRFSPNFWTSLPGVWSARNTGGGGNIPGADRSELDQHAANPPLGGADDEQLVVDRAHVVGVAEHVAEADEHFPTRRAAERHERQRLVDLDVEARVERRMARIAAARE